VLLSIEELSAGVQARLARALRDGEVRIGTGGAVPLKVRLVSIAGAALDADVLRGHFRADLRRRLGVVRMDLPPLSERREDIPEILRGLMAQPAAVQGVGARAFTDAALALIAALQWPDNVTGLARLAQALVGHGPAPVRVEEVLACLGAPGQNAILGPHASLREARRQFEREYIAAVLRRYDGRIAPAARALGIQRTNLYRKARQLGLHGGGRAS
jgi:DNA-binding NtrC family response regulator